MTYQGSRSALYDVFPDNPSGWPHYTALRSEGGTSVAMGVGDTLVIEQRTGSLLAGDVLARAFLLFEMSGTATFTITSDWSIGYSEGYGTGVDDWYAAMPANRVIAPFGTLSVNSVGVEKYWLPVPNPQAVHDRSATDGLLIRVTCTSGAAQFDFMAYQEEALDGYHYASGTHYSDWIPGPLVEYPVPRIYVPGAGGNITAARRDTVEDAPYDYSVMQALTAAAEGAPFSNSEWSSIVVGAVTQYWDYLGFGSHHIAELHFGYWAISLKSLNNASSLLGDPPPPAWDGYDTNRTGGWSSCTWPTWNGSAPSGQPALPTSAPVLSTIALGKNPAAIAPISWRPSTAAVPQKPSALFRGKYLTGGVAESQGDPCRIYKVPSSLIYGATTLSHAQYGPAIGQAITNAWTDIPLPASVWDGDFGNYGAALDLDMAGVAPSVLFVSGNQNAVRGGSFDNGTGVFIPVQFPDWRFSIQDYADGSAPMNIAYLRQKQRNDGLGRSVVRARGSSSRQSSTRQRGYL